jgi:hypothetical protein
LSIQGKKGGKSQTDAIEVDLSDDDAALQKVKEAEEKRQRPLGFGQRGPKSSQLLYWSIPKPILTSQGEKKWHFKCQYPGCAA